MRMRCAAGIVLLLTAACDPPATPGVAPTGRLTAPAAVQDVSKFTEMITVDLLKRHVEALSADSMEGRAAGSAGEERAALYIWREMQRAGVVAAGAHDVAGDTGYWQTFAISPTLFSRNCLGFLPGNDRALHNQVVIVMAHHDGLGKAGATRGTAMGGSQDGDEIWNGADDNASGVAAVLALAVAFRQSGLKLKRSILFMTTGNQEETFGLSGAKFYIDHSIAPRENHVLAINLEMIGRAERPVEIEGARTAKGDALPFAIKRAVEAQKLEAKVTDFGGEGLWRGDGALFLGGCRIPTLHVWGSWHKDWHRVSDSADRISYERLQQVTRAMFQVIRDAADAATPLQWNDQTPLKDDRPRLGVRLEDVPKEALAELGLPSGQGAVRVAQVESGGTGEKAGLLAGDAIIAFDGKPLNADNPLESLRGAIAKAEREKDYVVEVRRSGKTVPTTVRWSKSTP